MKKLTITSADGRKYTLEYNREAIKKMESRGFDIRESMGIVTEIDHMFYGALYMHHPSMTEDDAVKLLGTVKNKNGMLSALSDMLKEVIDYLFDDGDEGNAEWTVEE